VLEAHVWRGAGAAVLQQEADVGGQGAKERKKYSD
jgi:hypothetical protein